MSALHLKIAHGSLPCDGFRANGDRALLCRGSGAEALFGVIDVLGHGPEAAEVASLAHALFTRPLSAAASLQALDLGLRGTRGAAATLCFVDAQGVLEIGGVGNVGVRADGIKLGLVLAPGILGRRPRKLRCAQLEPSQAFRLAIFSDGVSPRFSLRASRDETPTQAVERILSSHGLPTDDRTVLIADFEVPHDS